MRSYFILLILPLTIANAIAQKRAVTLEDIWNSSVFNAQSVYGVNSMKDGIHYTSLDQGVINKYSYKTSEKVNTIVSEANLKYGDSEISIESYTFSSDETKLLIASDVEHIYRHSTRETNYVYDIASKTTSLLSEGAKQRYATFSPQGNKVAFVRENNLFVTDLSTNKEIQITKDGKFNEIINGATDWVYEEEFGFDKAFFWSADGKKIAYYRFDESNVKQFSMDTYGELYPSQYVFKYPKAGEENSKVTIHVYNLDENKTLDLNLGEYEYIPRIKWTQDPNLLSVQRMNRHQNVLDLILVNVQNSEQKIIINETSDTYVDISDNLTFLNNKKQFIWSSEKDGYNHLYLYDMDGQLINQITKGNWDVTSYKGYDEKSGSLFYISAESSPMERDLYSIRLDGTKKVKLSQRKGQNRATFSKGFKYYINYHSDANTPNFVSLHNAKGKQIKVLEDNQKLEESLKEFNLSDQEFFDFTTSEGTQLNGWMIKPQDFDQSKKYPVLMYVYGGPGIQTVHDRWGSKNYFWYQLLASKGYIVVSVDGRGTGARGSKFKKCTYKQLGKYETIDQIEAGKYLQTLPFVDKDRIGIWGWSYGGYMSSNCITKGNDLFKMAIAVAPVTNWRYYDSIYTERYMQTPQENAEGYDKNAPIADVDKLKGKYLLIHGMSDDNVHFQNAVEMTEALIRANKQFDLMMYPNRNHSIYGNNGRLHLYTKMTDFILENL